jgi:hypothetical protein
LNCSPIEHLFVIRILEGFLQCGNTYSQIANDQITH